MPWCAFNTWCLDMSYMHTLICLIWCLDMSLWIPWYALYGALRACQWRVRSQLSHSLLSSCLGFNQCQYCLSIFPIVIFLHSNESCFSLLLSSIISFTRGEVGVSSSAFPFTLHRFRVHRDQEAKIFRHSVQQVPSQTLNELESGDQLLVGTGDNYTDTVISMESFATHVKEEALKFWSFEAFSALKLWSFEADLAIQRSSPISTPSQGPTWNSHWAGITCQLKLYHPSIEVIYLSLTLKNRRRKSFSHVGQILLLCFNNDKLWPLH